MIPPPNIPLPLQMNMPSMPGVLPSMPRMVPLPSQIPHPIRTSQPNAVSTSSVTSVTSSGTTAPLLSAVGNDSEKVKKKFYFDSLLTLILEIIIDTCLL